jgi:putative endonuclease
MGLHHDQPTQWHFGCWRQTTSPGAWEHRAGLVEGFTRQYGLTRLVCAEHHDDMLAARQRERNMKHWRRSWKVQLILEQNPHWANLRDRLS